MCAYVKNTNVHRRLADHDDPYRHLSQDVALLPFEGMRPKLDIWTHPHIHY